MGPADENDEIEPAGSPRPFETEATLIAEAALAGDPTEPSWKRPYSLPAAATVGDARGGCALDRERDEVARRLDLGLAEREVDHVHPVGDRGLDRLPRSRDALPLSPKPSVGTVSTL